MDFKRAASAKRTPAEQSAVMVRVPVPYKGVDTVSPLSGLNSSYCHYAYNILPGPLGFRTRLGTVEWNNGIPSQPRTIIPYHGKTASADRLFVTGNAGIYNCSISGAGAAALVYPFVTPGVTAGYGNFITWTAANGDTFIQYADSANGLLEYSAATGVWAPVGAAITGISALDIRFVTVHKLRVWYITTSSPNAYYLPVAAKAGAATLFQLGVKFPHGGEAAGIYTFSHDSGNGPDDLFLAVGRAGDVVVYQGSDPSSPTTWTSVGSWYVGEVPTGIRFAHEFGGDVYILSANGFSSMKELFSGLEISGNFESAVGKLTNVFRTRMATEVNTSGWELLHFPAEGVLVVQSPSRANSTDVELHYCLSTTTSGWAFWRGIPSRTMGVWRNKLYYAKSDGSVWYQLGSRDNVSIASPAGSPVEFSFLCAYSDWEKPGQHKIPGFVRPIFLSESVPEYAVKCSFDYSLLEGTVSGDPAVATGSVWDVALWDVALWGGTQSYATQAGVGGVGLAVAVGIKGRAATRLTLAEITGTARIGGYL